MMEYTFTKTFRDDCIQKFNEYIGEYRKYNISDKMAEILLSKDILPEQANKIINNPFALIDECPDNNIYGAREAANRIIQNLEDNVKFLVFADYDVDGMVSGYIMTDFLRKIGADVFCYYPERSEGYGLSMNFAKSIDVSDGPWCVITVDNGITALEPIDYLMSKGIDVIVTDHHEPGSDLPDCVICDPWVGKERKSSHLCGAGVAWKVCMLMEYILEKKTLSDNLSIVEQYIPYLGIATIADVMPMTMENRAIVKIATEKMNSGNPGLYIEIFKKMFGIDNVSVKDIGWTIAPALNGASRMGNTQVAATSFYESNEDNLSKAFIKLNEYNRSRKSLQDEAIKKASQINYSGDEIILFDASEYPAGIYGILASKLCDMHGKPAIVYSSDGNLLSGSCRSIEGLDLKSLINKEASKGNAQGAAGHSGACGCVLYKNKLEEFKKGIEDSINDLKSMIVDLVAGTDNADLINEFVFVPDVEITVDDMTVKFLDEIRQVPFYKDEPVFLMKNISSEVITPFKNKNHLVIKLDGNDDKIALGWNMAEQFPDINKANKINIIGKLSSAGFPAKYLGLTKNHPVLMIEAIEIIR